MNFEYDELKSKKNQEKHGISLEEAKSLWTVPGVVVQARTADEPRFLRVGKLNEKFYSCVFTIRKEAIRLISARRSREEEMRFYKEKIENEKTDKED